MVHFGSVRRWALALAAASYAGGAAAPPNLAAAQIDCERAVKDWTPVRLPEAGVAVAIPCNDGELNAYKNANDEGKRSEGVAGCERAGRSYRTVYLVNTPLGFYDRFTAATKTSRVLHFQVKGHRVRRSVKTEDGKAQGWQLVEVDLHRSVLMTAESRIPRDSDFPKLITCFFTTLQFTQP